MLKHVLFTGLILFLFSEFATGQTKFKERVMINVVHIKDSSQKKIAQYSKLDSLDIMELKTRSKKVVLDINKGDQLITTVEKTINGKTYTVKSDSIFSQNDVIIKSISETYSERASISSGRYAANLYASNDTLYINFWLAEHNDSTYYDFDAPNEADFKFLPNKKYFITLKNRQAVSFWGHNWEIGAITLPFKMHFGFEENNVKVPAEFNTDINISTFVGRRLSRVNYRYDMYEGMKNRNLNLSYGAVLGFSAQEIDSSSTYLSNNPVLTKTSVPIFNLGVGLLFHISDFNLGVFYGWDFGIGTAATKWNFHQNDWLGFGLGYKIALFNKKE
ncbi:MAG: hypothetical protein HUJ22_02230 [Gracilimonas sp.]|uniref:hypothetical protein n=1 Tax=Gracilimonas sp. TaxID=1974203 RepID=UPI0019995C2F|nr:hypothetical protein [Gracilimonas sp.]MBD3615362.1 hypothetical protein [Gracilimonas sp.]